jgi:hypothetical protein
MLRVLQLEYQPDAIEAEVGAIDGERRREAHMRPDRLVGPRNGGPRDDVRNHASSSAGRVGAG